MGNKFIDGDAVPKCRGGSSLYSTRLARLDTNAKSDPDSTRLARQPKMPRLDWLDTPLS